MTTRIFTMLVFVMAAAVPRAETVGEWLAGELDEAITGPYVDAELKSDLIAAARLHGQDYDMTEMDECHRVLLDELVGLMGAIHGSEFGWQKRSQPVQYFVHRLIVIFHTTGFEREDIELVDAQITALVDALVLASADQFPEFLDDENQAHLREEWMEDLEKRANRCHVATLKFALPEEDFEALWLAVRTAPIEQAMPIPSLVFSGSGSSSSENRVREEIRNSGSVTLANELATAYRSHAKARFGEQRDLDALLDDLEAAGVENDGPFRRSR